MKESRKSSLKGIVCVVVCVGVCFCANRCDAGFCSWQTESAEEKQIQRRNPVTSGLPNFYEALFSWVLSSTHVKCLITCTVTSKISDGTSDKSNSRPQNQSGGLVLFSAMGFKVARSSSQHIWRCCQPLGGDIAAVLCDQALFYVQRRWCWLDASHSLPSDKSSEIRKQADGRIEGTWQLDRPLWPSMWLLLSTCRF